MSLIAGWYKSMNHYRLNSEQAMPKISIIIPTYNYGRFIRKALNSLLHQTFQDFEIIVVDDGSTDNTKDIIDTIFKENIRYFFSKKKGAASARNLGLRHATGKYVAFLDADDWLLPDSLELRIKFLKNHPEYDWVYGNWQIVDENGSYLGTADQFHLPPPEKRMGNLFPVLLSGANFIQTMSPLIKRKDLLSVGGFRTGLKASQDYELWCRLIDKGYRFENLKQVHVLYRQQKNQGKQKKLKLTIKNTLRVKQKYIFTRTYIRLDVLLRYALETILLFLPKKLVLWLFYKIR